jgi:hypothetical protein
VNVEEKGPIRWKRRDHFAAEFCAMANAEKAERAAPPNRLGDEADGGLAGPIQIMLLPTAGAYTTMAKVRAMELAGPSAVI